MLLSLVLFAPSAQAQEADVLPETVEVRYRQREEIDFDGVSIDGTLVGPEVELIGERARGRFNPLITLRTSFASEMVGSLDAVK